jgi:hypothetical protein
MNREHFRAQFGDELQWTLKIPVSEQMIDDIDKECRTLTWIETASKFIFYKHVVCLNLSKPGLAVLEDIKIWKIGKRWDSGRVHRIFHSFHDIIIAIILDHHESLQSRFWFDSYSPRYLCELKVSHFWPEFCFMWKAISGSRSNKYRTTSAFVGDLLGKSIKRMFGIKIEMVQGF